MCPMHPTWQTSQIKLSWQRVDYSCVWTETWRNPYLFWRLMIFTFYLPHSKKTYHWANRASLKTIWKSCDFMILTILNIHDKFFKCYLVYLRQDNFTNIEQKLIIFLQTLMNLHVNCFMFMTVISISIPLLSTEPVLCKLAVDRGL